MVKPAPTRSSAIALWTRPSLAVGAVTLALLAPACTGSEPADVAASTTQSGEVPAPSTAETEAPPVETEVPPTEPPAFELPELGAEAAGASPDGMADGTYAASINTVDALQSSLGLNLVTVELTDGVPVATDEDPLGLVDLPTNSATEILLLPSGNGGGGLASATQRELWNTMGKKDTGFDVRDSTVLFFTVSGGTITKIEQQPFIVLQ